MNEIVITGADGFLGSHCVDAALDRGLKVHALVEYRADGTYGNMEPFRDDDRVHIITGRLNDFSWLIDPHGRWDHTELPIINCAAHVSVPKSREMPNEYWHTNTEAVLHLAQLCPRLVQVSTSEVFDGRSAPYRVDSTRHPVTPYGASKAAAEVACLGYSGTARVVRVFNLFGPRQYPRAVHPIFIRAGLRIRRGLPARLAGPHGSRAFLYAPWVATQLVDIALSDTERMIQLSTNERHSIESLWFMVAGMIGVDPYAVEWDKDDGHTDVPDLWGESSPGFESPNYTPAMLRDTIAYYEGLPGFVESEPYQ